jgi:hypothetical protein
LHTDRTRCPQGETWRTVLSNHQNGLRAIGNRGHVADQGVVACFFSTRVSDSSAVIRLDELPTEKRRVLIGVDRVEAKDGRA